MATGKAKAFRQPTKTLARKYLAQVESRIASGKVGLKEASPSPRCKALMTTWSEGLTNRYAKGDQGRAKKHLIPVFGKFTVERVDLARIMQWLDDERAKDELSNGSIRHNLNLLSRFFSWAIERGHADVNPVRQIPTGRRPQQAAKTDLPWLDDDKIVRTLVNTIARPVNIMFYIGNRCGLRTGEIVGLRLSDMGFMADGAIRVRHSYLGPLKEDKHGTGKLKWVPAPDDWETSIKPWLDERRAAGAGPEDLVFPSVTNKKVPPRAKYITARFKPAIEALKLKLTWYQATRHSFVSRNLAAGASLDEVSSAVGHSSPGVTKRYYDHFLRKEFSPGLRAGLGIGGAGHGAQIIPFTPASVGSMALSKNVGHGGVANQELLPSIRWAMSSILNPLSSNS